MNLEKVFETVASDGKLEIFRNFLVENKARKTEYLYLLKESDNIIQSLTLTTSNFSKFWKLVYKKYSDIYVFDLIFVHEDLKTSIIKHYRSLLNKNVELNNSWKEKLTENKQILECENYFDFDYFLSKLKKFENKLDIKHWNYINLNHSKFNEKKEFSKLLKENDFFPLKSAGLYSYFFNNKCLYIGKAKNLQNRIESHWISSQNLGNLTRGEKHRKLFSKYYENDLTLYFTNLDDEFNSQLGEELRKTVENLLHLKYKPEFEEIKNGE